MIAGAWRCGILLLALFAMSMPALACNSPPLQDEQLQQAFAAADAVQGQEPWALRIDGRSISVDYATRELEFLRRIHGQAPQGK